MGHTCRRGISSSSRNSSRRRWQAVHCLGRGMRAETAEVLASTDTLPPLPGHSTSGNPRGDHVSIAMYQTTRQAMTTGGGLRESGNELRYRGEEWCHGSGRCFQGLGVGLGIRRDQDAEGCDHGWDCGQSGLDGDKQGKICPADFATVLLHQTHTRTALVSNMFTLGSLRFTPPAPQQPPSPSRPPPHGHPPASTHSPQQPQQPPPPPSP